MRPLVLESISRFVVVSSLVCSAASCSGAGGELFPDTTADIDADVDAAETLNLFDTLTNDTSPADADTANPSCPGGFMCPCNSNGDCLDQICIEGTAGNLCTRTCDANCPNGLACRFTSLEGSDPLSICVPRHTRLCRPCRANADCQNPLDTEPAVCLLASDSAVGSFCATSCKDTPCPSGYVCSDVNLGAAGRVDVCVPQSGQCACKPEWSGLGLETECRVENANGSCKGKRGCGPLGLSGCDAKIPMAETCNGIDDNCNDKIDEGFCVIEDRCIVADTVNPENPCERCRPGINTDRWTPTVGACDDGDLCTKNDACVDGKCRGEAYACPDDGKACTLEACTGTGSCSTTIAPGQCYLEGRCLADGERRDATGCLRCDAATNQWVAVQAGTTCDDGNACTTSDVCNGTTCAGTALGCDDGIACTIDTCTNGQCSHQVALGQCHLEGRCLANGERRDASGCLRCDAATNQWVAVQAGTTCDDGNPCTTGDACVGVECVGQGTCHPPYWSKKIGGASGDFLRQIIARPGKLVAVGQQTGVIPPNGEGAGSCFFDDVGVLEQRCDYYIVAFDAAGQTFERYTFGQPRSAFSQTGASRSFNDDGIVVTGRYANGGHFYSHIIQLDDQLRFVRAAELNPGGASDGLYAASVVPTATGYIVGNGTLYGSGGCQNGTAYTRLDATFNVLGKSPGVRDGCNGGIATALPSSMGGYWLLPAVHIEASLGIALTYLNGGDTFNWKRVVNPASGYPGTRAAVETAGQGLLIAGEILPDNGAGGYGAQGDAWFLATDASGYPLAQGLFGGPGDDEFRGVVALADGGYLLVGKNGSNGNPQGLVVRLDAAFQVKWQRSFGTPTTASGAFFLGGVEDASGDIYLVGQYDKAAWVVHLPPDGTPTSGVNPQFATRTMGALSTVDANFTAIGWDMNVYPLNFAVGGITNNQKPVTDAP